MKWKHDDIPPMEGKVAVVTGANSGLGLATARFLGQKRARVILACRNEEKGHAALAQLQAAVPEGAFSLHTLDLSSLQSVRQFAEQLQHKESKLDVLVNNAGVMGPPFAKTLEGFELQFGTNHLGHFALTGLLLPLLVEAPQGRVVTVSSLAAHSGKIRFQDLQWKENYDKWQAYSQSKLANLMFALELEDRLQHHRLSVTSLAAHPGFSSTNLFSDQLGNMNSLVRGVMRRVVVPLMSQSAEKGALPQLYAATAPDVEGGQFYGPRGPGEMFGHPKKARIPSPAFIKADRERLWNKSVELTGVSYPF
jgi:protochlorophyllide reductase